MNITYPGQLLLPVGRMLLVAAFGWQLIQILRGRTDGSTAIEGLVLGFVGLSFAGQLSSGLDGLSRILGDSVKHSLGDTNLRDFILKSLEQAGLSEGEGSSANLGGLLAQAWRTGVWGICTAVVEAVFLIIRFVLTAAREVLWALVWVVFPLGCGLSPTFPALLSNLVLYAVELTLWVPTLNLIEGVTAQVAKGASVKAGSSGIDLIAMEIVVIVLSALVPTFTHKFMSGAFQGDFGAQGAVFRWAKWLGNFGTKRLLGGGA